MSEAVDVLRRPHAGGWLILSGEIPSLGGATPELAERLLGHIDLSWPPLILTIGRKARAEVKRFAEEIETLIGVAPRMLDLGGVAPMEYAETSLAARFLLLLGGETVGWRSALDPGYPGLEAESLMADDRVVLAAGAAAAALGSWILAESSDTVEPGLGWLPDAIVLPGVVDPAGLEPVRERLQGAGKSYALGLPTSVLLALGPGNRIEVWSERSPVIALGAGWSRE